MAEATKILRNEPNLLEVDAPITGTHSPSLSSPSLSAPVLYHVDDILTLHLDVVLSMRRHSRSIRKFSFPRHLPLPTRTSQVANLRSILRLVRLDEVVRSRRKPRRYTLPLLGRLRRSRLLLHRGKKTIPFLSLPSPLLTFWKLI